MVTRWQMNNRLPKKIGFFILLVASQFSLNCTTEDKKLLGEWIGTSSGENTHSIGLTFYDNHFASVRIGDATVGGENDNSGRGRKVELAYEVNYSITPYTIKYTMIVDDLPNKEAFIKGIFRFRSKDSLEIRMWLGDDERFKTFDSNDKENQIVLRKRTKNIE